MLPANHTLLPLTLLTFFLVPFCCLTLISLLLYHLCLNFHVFFGSCALRWLPALHYLML